MNIEKIKKERDKFLKSKKSEEKRTTWTPNDILVYDNYAEVILRDKKQKIKGITLIDKSDIDLVKQFKWCLHNKGYVTSRYNGKTTTMQRILLNFPKGIIDHINRKKLDNKRSNLRIVTPKESVLNRTPINEKEPIIIDMDNK